MPKIMGILNLTPDSFSDGGLYTDTQGALAQARKLWESGADIIDVGAESTRPGAAPITAEEELSRLFPVVEEIVKLRYQGQGCLFSIDTYKPEVAKECLRVGFSIINDVTGLSNPKMRSLVKTTGCSAVIMHQGPGSTEDLQTFFQERIDLCKSEGIRDTQLIIDPGFGFGKTPQQNWEILNNLGCRVGGHPLLIGTSRKSFHDGHKRYKTLDTLRIAWGHADIVRIHDLSLLEKI